MGKEKAFFATPFPIEDLPIETTVRVLVAMFRALVACLPDSELATLRFAALPCRALFRAGESEAEVTAAREFRENNKLQRSTAVKKRVAEVT